MPIIVRDLNNAAKLIASKLGMLVAGSVDEAPAQFEHIRILWRFADAHSTKYGHIRLDCELSSDSAGKSWFGFVSIELASDLNSKLVRIAGKRLVEPWKLLDGQRARRLTKSGFCKFATEFVPNANSLATEPS